MAAERASDDGRLLLLAEVTLGGPPPRHHRQQARPEDWPGGVGGAGWWHWWGSGPVGVGGRGGGMSLQRPKGALQRLDRVGPLGGQVLDGSATGPLQLQGVLEFSNPGQHQAGRRLGDSKARPSVLGRVGGPGVVAGRLPAAPGSGCAMPRAGRGWGLAAGGRLGSARRPGSGGSSRPIPRTAEPPQRSSGSAVTTGPARSR